jgi:hypothetical protein
MWALFNLWGRRIRGNVGGFLKDSIFLWWDVGMKDSHGKVCEEQRNVYVLGV